MVLSSSLAKCQTANIISQTDYNNIEINGVKLIDLKNTYGETNAIQTLFGTPVSKNIDIDGDFFNYTFKDFKIGFSALLSDDFNKPILSKFELNGSSSEIKIQGTIIKVNDNISKLENLKFNTDRNGDKSIIYMACDGCNNFISINFNQTTNTITKITYIEMT
jgi:hypothetical protein